MISLDFQKQYTRTHIHEGCTIPLSTEMAISEKSMLLLFRLSCRRGWQKEVAVLDLWALLLYYQETTITTTLEWNWLYWRLVVVLLPKKKYVCQCNSCGCLQLDTEPNSQPDSHPVTQPVTSLTLTMACYCLVSRFLPLLALRLMLVLLLWFVAVGMWQSVVMEIELLPAVDVEVLQWCYFLRLFLTLRHRSM